jgi:hypothetical protein
MNERLEELYSIYNDTYQELYNSHTELTEVIESHFSRLHDNDMKHDPDYKKAVQTIAEYRQDIFSRDRECAAIYLAVLKLDRRDNLRHIIAYNQKLLNERTKKGATA